MYVNTYFLHENLKLSYLNENMTVSRKITFFSSFCYLKVRIAFILFHVNIKAALFRQIENLIASW